jgi:hypothetical protein
MKFKLNQYDRKRVRLASILVSVFVIGACFLGSYHLTHGGGWRSGVAELGFAILVAILAFGFHQIRPKVNNLAQGRYLHVAWLIVIWGLALVLFILSLYHFTHQGLPSGIIEMTFTFMLTAIGFMTLNPKLKTQNP